mgnify:CR=1 FL=1
MASDRPARWVVSSGIEMLAGGCLQGLLALFYGALARFAAAPSSRAVWSMVYLVVVGAWCGYGAFSWLIRHARPTLVATYS